MKKVMNLLKKNILIVFGLVIGIMISNMVIGATSGGGLSAGSVDIDTTNMPLVGENKKLDEVIKYLYDKAETFGDCSEGKNCIEKGYTVEWADNKTYLGIVYLNPADLSAICNATLASQNLNMQSTPTPTEVKTGCMKWYIYGTDRSNNYLAILDHNTTAIVQWNTTSTNGNVAFENSVAYSYLTDLTKPVSQGGSGWVLPTRIISGQEIADLTGNGSWSASGSMYYFGSNNSTEYSNMDAMQKAKQQSFAWLFDYIGFCDSYGSNHSEGLYEIGSDTHLFTQLNGYWTITPRGTAGAGSSVWCVHYYGSLNACSADGLGIGLRPVITLPKGMLE